MRSYLRLTLYTTTLFLVLALSAILTVPAYADGETPPVEPPVATEPTEPPAQDEVTEEAAPPTPPETALATEEIPAAESVEPILAEVPQGTEVVVINEEGETVPLATEEAAKIIITGDPLWCPATKAVPTPGVGGCSASFASLADLVTELSTAGGLVTNPGMDGVIWIASNYNAASDNAAILIDGGTLSVMSTFKLTLKGGWCDGTDVTCAGLIDVTKPSTFDVPIVITGWTNDVTLSNITITGTSAGADALEVATTKNITLTNVKSNNNTGRGANLHNGASGTGNVTVTNSQFNFNTGVHGLLISSNGIITLKDVTANNNANGFGAYLDNDAALTAKVVTLTGTNTFNFNGTSSGSSGLYVTSLGAITVNNVTANGNGTGANGRGIELFNDTAALPKAIALTNTTASDNRNYGILIQSFGLFTGTDLTAVNNGLGGTGSGLYINNAGGIAGVTLNGTNLFFSNVDYGLDISSRGAIKLNNINAVDNGQSGARVNNASAVTPQAVTLTGTNIFKFNNQAGLEVYSLGQITANNITANSGVNSVGATLFNNTGPATSGVTLTGTNIFNDNDGLGLSIQTAGAVTINAITANDNGFGSSGDGVNINNTFGTLFKGVTLTGLNTFNNNNGEGLEIISEGVVTLSNLNASGNTGNSGVLINNTASTPATPKAVTINGTNVFKNNSFTGLYILTHGAITTNNLTASNNGIVNGTGAYLDNNVTGATITPANVTLNGINTFNGNYSEGLYILTLGAIKANSITANDSVNASGAGFNNSLGASTGAVMLTGTNTFTGNQFANLSVYSFGVISLNNVTASNSIAGLGAILDNSTAATPKAITLSGTNNFSGNWFSGLNLTSDGAITANNLTVNGNGASGTSGNGAVISNSDLGNTGGVTLTGNNSFNNNYGVGLQISTNGNIKTNNITAKESVNSYGVFLVNGNVGSTGGVTMTGTNSLTGNKQSNLEIYTNGAISINNLTANGSVTGLGAYIYHNAGGALLPKPLTITGINAFNNNYDYGLFVSVYGAITTNNLTAAGNGIGGSGIGVYLTNESAPTPAGITMNGTNVFTANDDANLIVRSKGAILANNVTASGSVNSFGAGFNNADFGPTVGNVTLTGINNFSNNFDSGIGVGSRGSITINSVTANNNGGTAVSLDNTLSGFATPKPVTVAGYLTANNNTIGTFGLRIYTYGAVITNNVTASGNTGYGMFVDNNLFDTTIPSNVTMNGTNAFIGNTLTGLYIDTFGSIVANNITSTGSVNGDGAELSATTVGAIGAVTLKGTNTFTGNFSQGLYIDVMGTVSLNNITASYNGDGIYISNDYTPAKPVTLTGTNVFSNNSGGYGLYVFSRGAITTNNLTASNNGTVTGSGVVLNNSSAVLLPANVSIKGTNTFNGNFGTGLEVYSRGSITLNNATANNNQNSASVHLDNDLGASTALITLTGVNTFSNNEFSGLLISSNGAVTLSKVTADGNGGDGLDVTTTGGNFTLTCGSFVNNFSNGVLLVTSGNATLVGVISAGNANNIDTSGVTGVVIITFGCPLP